uniref:Methyltransferase-like protein 4 n=1 Tax=Heterorhabditis bacteriophora TaxID=37862 RepID=A0A1I7XTT2_HETBA
MSQSMGYVDVRFAILDEQAYYRDIFRNLSVELDPDLMEINGPFIMDSQFEALNKEQRRNRKRKKESYVQEEFSKVCSAVANMAKNIRNIGRDLGYFQATSIKDNNKASREAARRVMKDGITFDLIVMDPPWYNLSVKRKGRYVMNDSILKQITIDSLSPRGLVAIWITNRKGIAEEVAIHLKRWNLKRLVVWHWLKVTKEGEPVCEFHLSHKVPFESLILAVREECAPEYCKKLPSDGFIFSR